MDELAVGFVRGAHGTHGEVKVGSYSGELDHLSRLRAVSLRCRHGEQALEVERVRLTHREAIVKFAGIDTRDAALGLNRCEIWAPRAYAAPRQEDEFYISDLVGCVLVSRSTDGTELARVLAVWDSGSCDMLEVKTNDGSVQNVPFRRPFIGEVDLDERKIELLEPWVLE